jgi:hypothetical protein
MTSAVMKMMKYYEENGQQMARLAGVEARLTQLARRMEYWAPSL